jgi:hypothetical protein
MTDKPQNSLKLSEVRGYIVGVTPDNQTIFELLNHENMSLVELLGIHQFACHEISKIQELDGITNNIKIVEGINKLSHSVNIGIQKARAETKADFAILADKIKDLVTALQNLTQPEESPDEEATTE